MNTTYLVITLLLVFTAFTVAPVFAIEADEPGVVVDLLSLNKVKDAPGEMSVPSGTPAAGRRDVWDPLNNNEDNNNTNSESNSTT